MTVAASPVFAVKPPKPLPFAASLPYFALPALGMIAAYYRLMPILVDVGVSGITRWV